MKPIIKYVCLILFLAAVITGCPITHEQPDIEKIIEEKCAEKWEENMHKFYNMGFNHALACLSLLNLELSLEGKQKTFGEMNEICRNRHHVDAEFVK